jgi:hypothetical protein
MRVFNKYISYEEIHYSRSFLRELRRDLQLRTIDDHLIVLRDIAINRNFNYKIIIENINDENLTKLYVYYLLESPLIETNSIISFDKFRITLIHELINLILNTESEYIHLSELKFISKDDLEYLKSILDNKNIDNQEYLEACILCLLIPNWLKILFKSWFSKISLGMLLSSLPFLITSEDASNNSSGSNSIEFFNDEQRRLEADNFSKIWIDYDHYSMNPYNWLRYYFKEEWELDYWNLSDSTLRNGLYNCFPDIRDIIDILIDNYLEIWPINSDHYNIIYSYPLLTSNNNNNTLEVLESFILFILIPSRIKDLLSKLVLKIKRYCSGVLLSMIPIMTTNLEVIENNDTDINYLRFSQEHELNNLCGGLKHVKHYSLYNFLRRKILTKCGINFYDSSDLDIWIWLHERFNLQIDKLNSYLVSFDLKHNNLSDEDMRICQRNDLKFLFDKYEGNIKPEEWIIKRIKSVYLEDVHLQNEEGIKSWVGNKFNLLSQRIIDNCYSELIELYKSSGVFAFIYKKGVNYQLNETEDKIQINETEVKRQITEFDNIFIDYDGYLDPINWIRRYFYNTNNIQFTNNELLKQYILNHFSNIHEYIYSKLCYYKEINNSLFHKYYNKWIESEPVSETNFLFNNNTTNINSIYNTNSKKVLESCILFLLIPNKLREKFINLFRKLLLIITFLKEKFINLFRKVLLSITFLSIKDITKDDYKFRLPESDHDKLLSLCNPHLGRFPDIFEFERKEIYLKMVEFIGLNNKWKGYRWLYSFHSSNANNNLENFISKDNLYIIFQDNSYKFKLLLDEIYLRENDYYFFWNLSYNYKDLREYVITELNLTPIEKMYYYDILNQRKIWYSEYLDDYNNDELSAYSIHIRTKYYRDYYCEIPNIFNNIFYGCDLEFIHPFNWIKLVFNELLVNSNYNDILSFISIYYSGDKLEAIKDWTNKVSRTFNTTFVNNERDEIVIKQEDEDININNIPNNINRLNNNNNTNNNPFNIRGQRRLFHKSFVNYNKLNKTHIEENDENYNKEFASLEENYKEESNIFYSFFDGYNSNIKDPYDHLKDKMIKVKPLETEEEVNLIVNLSDDSIRLILHDMFPKITKLIDATLEKYSYIFLIAQNLLLEKKVINSTIYKNEKKEFTKLWEGYIEMYSPYDYLKNKIVKNYPVDLTNNTDLEVENWLHEQFPTIGSLIDKTLQLRFAQWTYYIQNLNPILTESSLFLLFSLNKNKSKNITHSNREKNYS